MSHTVEFDEQTRQGLERFKLVLTDSVSKEGLHDALVEGSEMASYMRQQYTLRIRGWIWGERMGVVTVRYPANWWQGVRQRWWPAWALRRWPVTYTAVPIRADVIYPEFTPALPDETIVRAVVRT